VISRERFLKELWGGDLSVGNRTIDTHVLNLRQKLEPDPREPRFLLTVHGLATSCWSMV
jgi:two-component system alkaline phosphatase synthesis response regulator PhoP